MLIGLIITGLLLIVIIWILIERKQLVTTRYTVKSEKLAKAFDQTRFVILSDLHNSTFGKNNKRLIRKIERLSPEFIIVVGDMINKTYKCYPGNAFSLLSQLSGKYPIYYAYGNHEQNLEKPFSSDNNNEKDHVHSTWITYKEQLSKGNVAFLNNQSIFLEKGGDKLRISGVSIEKKYFEHGKQYGMEDEYLSTLIGEKTGGMYNILIAHNPTYFSSYVQWGADLIISGHLHGGMVRLPFLGGIVSPQVGLFPKYSSGLHQKNESQILVSRGLGSHSFMPRMFNVPEIVFVELISVDKSTTTQ
jgi:uncharacterized protein